jgi:hypothetical protein
LLITAGRDFTGNAFLRFLGDIGDVAFTLTVGDVEVPGEGIEGTLSWLF